MATRVTRKEVDVALKYARALQRFISSGLVEPFVPDKYERMLATITDVLRAARPLFPAK